MAHISNKTIRTEAELGIKALDVDFIPKEFRTTIETQGYEVIYERALRCPCKERSADHLNTCDNCGGSGWLFVNPTKTKMVLTGIGLTREYLETAAVDLGMLYATPVSLLKLSQMDRITVLDGESAQNEIVYLERDDISGDHFALLHYHIKDVEWVGLFEDVISPIKRLLLDEDYTFENNKILLNSKYNGLVDPQISIRYVHFSSVSCLGYCE